MWESRYGKEARVSHCQSLSARVQAAPLTYSTPGTDVVVVMLTAVVALTDVVAVVVNVVCVELVDVADVPVLVVEFPVVIV